MDGSNALGEFLRARRDQLRPQDAGLRATGPRRVPGLRREEVAMLAGISPDYYLRLGRARPTRRPQVLAYRLENDRWCTGQRFAAYRALLGDAFDGRVLADDVANTNPPPFFRDVVGCAHSVTTAHLVDEQGHPTTRARDEIIAFLAERLGTTTPDTGADGPN
ncbi:hypothetical protein [Streptomyces sp. NPDC001536]|uniref:hypothetical protein n=1 Tax=Streptomyces sp. NPDC001536 TaxID=3364583 RepID=UPI0036C7BEB1